MNCEQVHNLLGRLHDGELGQSEQAVVQTHLHDCSGCAAELAAFTELTEMVQTWGEVEPPADLWGRIVGQLAATGPKPASVRKPLRYWKAAVVAALVLIAVTTGWLAHRPSSSPNESAKHQSQHTEPVVDLGASLGPQVSLLPGEAQRLTPEQTAKQVNFRVVTSPKLPEGYALEESYLVRIEGCNVVQSKYLRGADVALLLQYSQGQPVSFGDRPIVAIEKVNGKPVQIVQGDGHLAASWKANGTAVSLVGLRDRSELVRLVAYVDQQLAEDKK